MIGFVIQGVSQKPEWTDKLISQIQYRFPDSVICLSTHPSSSLSKDSYTSSFCYYLETEKEPESKNNILNHWITTKRGLEVLLNCKEKPEWICKLRADLSLLHNGLEYIQRYGSPYQIHCTNLYSLRPSQHVAFISDFAYFGTAEKMAEFIGSWDLIKFERNYSPTTCGFKYISNPEEPTLSVEQVFVSAYLQKKYGFEKWKQIKGVCEEDQKWNFLVQKDFKIWQGQSEFGILCNKYPWILENFPDFIQRKEQEQYVDNFRL